MSLIIRELFGPDINEDFLKTISALSDPGLTVNEAREIFRSRLRTHLKTYVAVLGGRVVGTATLLIERKFLHKGAYAAHIEDVAVHPDHQRHGIGTALVRFLVEDARKRKCYKIILDCFEHLAPFYERIGFRISSIQMRCEGAPT